MTKVLVTVSISTRVPDWLLNSDKGWVTAEYNMLPGSSGNRISRKSFEVWKV
jgi:ribonuclease PH